MTGIRLLAAAAVAPGIDIGSADGPLPRFDPACLASTMTDGVWFDAVRMLPDIKHRYLNDTVRHSLAATLRCPQQPTAGEIADERLGVFLGTAVADFAVRERFDHAVLAHGVDSLNTVSAPNMSANIAAAHVAILSGARAFSTTLTSPFLAGFESLYLGMQSLRLGLCDEVLAIAAEESLPPGADCRVLPGAFAVRLSAGAAAEGRELQGLGWGRDVGTAEQAFGLSAALMAQPAFAWRDARLVVVHDPSPAATDFARRATYALQARTAIDSGVCIVVRGPGSLEPMLCIAHWLTVDYPVVLLAIYRQRYLSFLIHP